MDGQENAENFSRFLIIGGGISGLAAASTLAQRGIKDFRILEARKRLGGRISTVSIGGSKAELGANWIHGILGNPIYELAASNRLVEVGQPPKSHNVAATTTGEEFRSLFCKKHMKLIIGFLKDAKNIFCVNMSLPRVSKVLESISIWKSLFICNVFHITSVLYDGLFLIICSKENAVSQAVIL